MKTSNQYFESQTELCDGNVEDSYPLSPLQHGMLFHYLLERASGVYIEQIVVTLYEDLDLKLFRQAWQRVVSRHAILRTVFQWEGISAPQQNIHHSMDVPLQDFDWCGLSPEEQRNKLDDYLQQDRSTGFDMASAPLFRIAAFRTSVNSSIVLWTFHHALLDGTSYRIAIREVFAFYDAFLEKRDLDLELPRPYKNYIEWEKSLDLGKAETFWRGRLGDFSSPTPLVLDRNAGNDSNTAYERGQIERRLPASVTASLRRIANENDLTLNTVVQAAWSLLLSFYSNETDVVFGVTRACRHSDLEGLETMLGLFINTIPIRVKVERTLSVLDLLRAVRKQHLELGPYENTPLIKIQEWSGLGSNSALFESILVFDNAELNNAMRALGGKWEHRNLQAIEQTNYAMTLFAYGESELLLRLVYDESRFDEASVVRMVGHFEKLLTSIADDPQDQIAKLSLLTDEERLQILDKWNATSTDYSKNVCIHQLFEVQAERTPDAIALAFEDRELTYADLNCRANQLGKSLAELGVGPDRLVGISVTRSPEMVVAMLAILKAGGAYVPLDPGYPSERLEYMIQDADIGVLITESVFDHLTVGAQVQIINIDEFGDDADGVESFNVSSSVGPDNLAYVIYTSGSTGAPKGVMVEHRNVVNFFSAIDGVIGTDPGVWLAVTSISFDISVMELLWTLTRGFKVVIQGSSTASAYAFEEPVVGKPMDFSLFYFASDHGEGNEDKYRLLLEGARFADANHFTAVWTPERHFHSFGGLYPNPSITSAAIAAITKHIRIRAGSVVLPLHDPLRIAEEWSVVDNISRGRVDIAFASGWHASDFALAPESYIDRKEIMRRGVNTVQSLWRGETITRTSGDKSEVELRIFPQPLQSSLPIWLTAAGSPDTFRAAGELGANLLTNLLGQSIADLAEKIRVYRVAWAKGDHGSSASTVTLMLHTFISDDADYVREKVRKPFTQYLKTSVDLIKNAPWAYPAFQSQSRQKAKDQNETLAGETVTESDLDALAEHAFDRYFEICGLFGTPESCLSFVNRLKEIGVDEIACLVDFNVDVDSVLEGLEHLDKLRQLSSGSWNDYSIPAQIARHHVTHLQCTPSAARLMVSDPRTLASLRSLKHIALGGEGLPAALVREIGNTTRATIYNMYGPTETTIWSTSSTLAGTETNISIGRPFANTQIFILNSDLQPVPVGIPGELYIGGDGVARGYLRQPELTAERFIRNPFDVGSSRLYKTGDVAAYRPDGTIEFQGRVDHQVKVRGYRVEPEEIQELLDRHPEVRQSVVHARDDGADGKALIAYIVSQEPDQEQAQHEQIARWNSVWNEAYGRNGNATPSTNDFAGWNSSYDGQPIPEVQMNEWLDGTVSKILKLKPSRVLEIGCGTGLLLFKIAPSCLEYWGTDISKEALNQVKRTIRDLDTPLRQVSLFERPADEFNGLPEGSFDLVVLNSVIQYFPDKQYLLKVLRGAMRLVRPGGDIFIGDVRSLELLEAFHASIELQRATDMDSSSDLLKRIRERIAREEELAVAPEFFEFLRDSFYQIGGVEITLKKGRTLNELSKYRYDVRLKVGDPDKNSIRPDWIKWSESLSTADDLQAFVNGENSDVVAIAGIPNRRLRSEFVALTALKGHADSHSIADLWNSITDSDRWGLDPASIWELAEGTKYMASVRWSPDGPDRFDAVFRRGATEAEILPGRNRETKPVMDLTNHPVSGLDMELVARLRTHLKQKLPPYMVPSAFVLIDEIPLTPNGKLDRSALPPGEASLGNQDAGRAAPANELEEAIAEIWTEILGVDKVDADSSFFHVGGHSLLATQLVSRLRATFRVDISLREVFDFPTITGIAECLLRSEREPGQVRKIAEIIKQVSQMPAANGNGRLSQEAAAQ